MGAIAQGVSPNSSPTENAHLAGPVPAVSRSSAHAPNHPANSISRTLRLYDARDHGESIGAANGAAHRVNEAISASFSGFRKRIYRPAYRKTPLIDLLLVMRPDHLFPRIKKRLSLSGLGAFPLGRDDLVDR